MRKKCIFLILFGLSEGSLNDQRNFKIDIHNSFDQQVNDFSSLGIEGFIDSLDFFFDISIKIAVTLLRAESLVG